MCKPPCGVSLDTSVRAAAPVDNECATLTILAANGAYSAKRVKRMPFELPRNFQISDREPLEQVMARLRSALRIHPESAVTLQLAEDPGFAKAAPQTAAGEQNSAGNMYRTMGPERKVFVATRIDPPSLLAERHSLSELRRSLAECETILAHFAAGPSREGFLGRMLNVFQQCTRRVLNWFIGPSISFDKSALNAVAETAAAVDVVQRQIYLMAQELAVLSDKLESLEERNSQFHSSP